MSLSLDVYETHGLSGQDGAPRVCVQEARTGHVFLGTKSISGAMLTASEARYLAARLLRLAWRIDARAKAEAQS